MSRRRKAMGEISVSILMRTRRDVRRRAASAGEVEREKRLECTRRCLRVRRNWHGILAWPREWFDEWRRRRTAGFFDAFVRQGTRILICERRFDVPVLRGDLWGRIDACRYGRGRCGFPLGDVLRALKKSRTFSFWRPEQSDGNVGPLTGTAEDFWRQRADGVVFDEAYADYSGLTMTPWIGSMRIVCGEVVFEGAGLASLRLGE